MPTAQEQSMNHQSEDATLKTGVACLSFRPTVQQVAQWALEAIEAGPNAAILMNLEGIKDHLRNLARSGEAAAAAGGARRERFEAWMRNSYPGVHLERAPGNGYTDHRATIAWQACAALSAPQPEAAGVAAVLRDAPDDAELEGWRAASDRLLAEGGYKGRAAALLLQNAYAYGKGLRAAILSQDATPQPDASLERRDGFTMKDGVKSYCCYGMYAEVGHSADCKHATPQQGEVKR